uniref:Protochlorophyllide reductase n=1 Tax=Pyrodinium bahamense TaxID=73915 RepID=A0A7S0FJU5_9DINO
MGDQPGSEETAAAEQHCERKPLIVLLTGATDGIGRCIARLLAPRSNLRLLVHCRDPAKGAALVEELAAVAADSAEISYHVADFGRLDDVEALAKEVVDSVPSLDVLINNAGAGPGPDGAQRREAHDGHEYILTVNTLAPYLLSERLHPLLAKGQMPRVVHVASLGQAPFDLDNLDLTEGYSGLDAYRRSKLAIIMLGFQQAARWEADAVSVHSLHPGTLLNTTMVREHWKEVRGEPQEGADSVLHVALSKEVEGTGKFFDRKRPSRALADAYDPRARQKLEALVREWTRLA